MNKRPRSITVISWIFIVFGLIALLYGLLPNAGITAATNCRAHVTLVRTPLQNSDGCWWGLYALRLQLGALAGGCLDSFPHRRRRPSLDISVVNACSDLLCDSIFSFSAEGVGLFPWQKRRCSFLKFRAIRDSFSQSIGPHDPRNHTNSHERRRNESLSLNKRRIPRKDSSALTSAP